MVALLVRRRRGPLRRLLTALGLVLAFGAGELVAEAAEALLGG